MCACQDHASQCGAKLAWLVHGLPRQDQAQQIHKSSEYRRRRERSCRQLPMWGMLADSAKDFQCNSCRNVDSDADGVFTAMGRVKNGSNVMRLLVSTCTLSLGYGCPVRREIRWCRKGRSTLHQRRGYVGY